MKNNDARRDVFSIWFVEFSVLWAVFPMLDRVVEGRALDRSLTMLSVGISLTTLVLGVMLKPGGGRWTE
jgi:hypothetical protein